MRCSLQPCTSHNLIQLPLLVELRFIFMARLGVVSAGLVIARRVSIIEMGQAGVIQTRKDEVRMMVGDLALGLIFPLGQLVICKSSLYIQSHQLTLSIEIGSFKVIASISMREWVASSQFQIQYLPYYCPRHDLYPLVLHRRITAVSVHFTLLSTLVSSYLILRLCSSYTACFLSAPQNFPRNTESKQ